MGQNVQVLPIKYALKWIDVKVVYIDSKIDLVLLKSDSSLPWAACMHRMKDITWVPLDHVPETLEVDVSWNLVTSCHRFDSLE
jgi:hypothetical protein